MQSHRELHKFFSKIILNWQSYKDSLGLVQQDLNNKIPKEDKLGIILKE